MSIVFLDGNFIAGAEAKISAANRAFRYADGCFEAIRVMDGSPVFWSRHWQRLTQTLALLYIERTWSEGEMKQWVRQLLEANIARSGMLRLMVSRTDGGRYLPVSNAAQVFMEFTPMEHAAYAEPPQHRRAVLFYAHRLPSHVLGNHKTLNKTLHVLAAIYTQQQGCDEAFLLNDRGEVAEAISSNVFVVKDGAVITPPLASGGLDGTIRRTLLEHQNALGLTLGESVIMPDDLRTAEELWTTNAGSGITCVSAFDGKTYGSELAASLQPKLNALALSSTVDFRESLP